MSIYRPTKLCLDPIPNWEPIDIQEYQRIHGGAEGTRASDEAYEALRVSQTGVPKSPEQRDKMTQSHLNRWEQNKDRYRDSFTKKLGKRVLVEGTIYESVAQAARELGITPNTAYGRVNRGLYEYVE